ncbi:hypothetical protein BDV97DRAFT_397752 [Delphinella strobiligena]|nr:hypothetical protein BDV97DRAFT_397752 [Delphinella strobiligena]
MRRGRLLFACLIVLFQYSSAVTASIWSVDIDEGPAPSPEDGPPFSAHATRDRTLLPGQICGIVGAYLASVVLTGSLLLTVGRRLRRQAQSIHMSPAEELKTSNVFAFGASPVSPGSQRWWYSPRRLKQKTSMPGSMKSGTNLASPGIESTCSFDPSVIEADKAARELELENLYAAALAQEASRSQSIIAEEGDFPEASKSPSRTDRRPPRLLTSAAHLQPHFISASPTSTKSPIRAIYPPDSSHGYPVSPASQGRAEYQHSPVTPRYPPSPAQYRPPEPPYDRLSGSASLRSQTGGHGGHKRFRKALRNLHISAPIPISPGGSSDQDARTPLTPRYYIDPGVPPSPPTRSEAPTTPATYRSTSHDSEFDIEGIDQIRDLPMAAPQRKSDHQYNNVAQVSAGPAGHDATSTSTLGTLPFRAMSNQQSAKTAQSPGLNTKVTYLERRRDFFNAPRTGAATPYTPYMPFTPITPVTPHLTSRAERKQRQKEQARRAPAEEDRVLEEDELWGSGY